MSVRWYLPSCPLHLKKKTRREKKAIGNITPAQSAGSKPETLGAFSGKIASSWHSVLADLLEGSNRGEHLETVSSSLVYMSGFWTGHHI